MKIKKVGIIGAGQMGSGIAHVCALAGFDVGVNDVSKDRIDAGLNTINGNLGRQLKSGKITEAERAAALKRITPVMSSKVLRIMISSSNRPSKMSRSSARFSRRCVPTCNRTRSWLPTRRQFPSQDLQRSRPA